MKNLILFLFIIVCANYKSQIFECNNIDRYELNYIYKQNENKFKVVIGDINYMQKSIDGLEIKVIKQICINNWTIYDKMERTICIKDLLIIMVALTKDII